MNSIFSLAINTFRESVRSKFLYSILIFALFIVVVSSVFGMVTIGDHLKVIKDFGFFSLNIFCVAYIVITGSALLHKELSRKTIFNILSKPVPRYQFLVGKFLGMLMTVAVMLVLMSVSFFTFVSFYEGSFDPSLLIGVYSIFLQMVILCALAILLSAILLTPLLSGVITFAIFIAGRSTEFIQSLYEHLVLPDIVSKLVNLTYYALPHLDKIDVTNIVVYGETIGLQQLLWNTIYTVTYTAIMLILAVIFFRRREFT